MSSFKKSPLAYIDDEIAQLAAAQNASFDALESPPSSTKYLSEIELKYLAQTTFKEDFSDFFPKMTWSKTQ